MRTPQISGVVVLALAAGFCATACSSAYYGMMETFGYAKRDILVDRVEEGRDAQQEAKTEFKDALEAFKSVNDFDGGDLEKIYKDLNSHYEDCKSSTEEVQERIASIEKVSNDLFTEWKKEIGEMSSADLRSKSEAILRDTQNQYSELIAAMKKAEAKMHPVLTDFHDRVLFLKHNLNAQAIASLRGELGKIESNVGDLIAEMEKSIAEADSFIASMEKS